MLDLNPHGTAYATIRYFDSNTEIRNILIDKEVILISKIGNPKLLEMELEMEREIGNGNGNLQIKMKIHH